jgi:hypothetical protein
MSENRKFRGFYLNEYQSEFVNEFLNPNSQPYHLLLAPIGSGKTAISSVIVSEMVKTGAMRILVLAPARALVDQYKKTLGDFVEDLKVITLDRKIIREIETLNQQETFWVNSLAITTTQMAASDEIRDHILAISWDLVIMDDPGNMAKGSYQIKLLASIMEKQAAKRILVLSDPVQSIYGFSNNKNVFGNILFSKFEVTKWSRKNMFTLEKSARDVKLNIVNYERTKEEIDFVRKYISLSKWLKNKKFQNKIRSRLVSSSLYAAEESLRSLRNRLVHGDLNTMLAIDETGSEYIKDEELLGDISTDSIDTKSSNMDLANLVMECEKALSLLDRTQVDSKLNALLSLFADRNISKSKTWVYASYLSTISYLYSSLREKYKNIYQVSSQLESSKNADALNRFKSYGGTLIASVHFLKGLELPVDNLILYDVPESKELMYLIASRVLHSRTRDSKSTNINIIMLNDVSEVARTEKTRLQGFQKFLEQLIQDEI